MRAELMAASRKAAPGGRSSGGWQAARPWLSGFSAVQGECARMKSMLSRGQTGRGY